MIEFQGVSKSYGTKRALDQVTFAAPAGAVTGLVGPNGAGKSTLLRAALGLTPPDVGRATIGGAPFSDAPCPGQLLGAMLSAESIPPYLTAPSYLGYVSDLHQVPRRRAREVLEEVGLAGVGKKKVRDYSLGMRQRLGLAAAMMASPQNLILDEPFNGLDPEGILMLRDWMSRIAERGGAVLVSSHHMSELALVADVLVMLNDGRVVRQGQLSEFVSAGSISTYFESSRLDEAIAVLRAQGYEPSASGAGAVVQNVDPEIVGRILFVRGPGASMLRSVQRTLEETYFNELSDSVSGGH